MKRVTIKPNNCTLPINETDHIIIGTARKTEGGFLYDFEYGTEFYPDSECEEEPP